MRRVARYLFVLGIVFGILLSFASSSERVAFADTSDELKVRLEKAKTTRDDLYAKAEEVSEALNGTLYQLELTQTSIDETNAAIDQTKQEIQVTQDELAKRRDDLSSQVVQDYKSGGFGLLDLVLSSRSLEEFISHIYYADKVSELQAATIQDTKTLEASLEAQKGELVTEEETLETQKSEQEELAQQQKTQQAELKEKAAEADAYVAGLDQELKDALEEEAARAREEAARRAAADAAARAAQQQQQQRHDGTSSSGSSNAQVPARPSGGYSSSGGYGLTQAQRDTIVSTALSMVGGNYSWGGYDPGSRTFDCSGLTMYCYAQVGISLPHNSDAQMSLCSVRPISECLPGDLVFFSGHVAIYYGDGLIIDASSPSVGIIGPHQMFRTPYGGGTPA